MPIVYTCRHCGQKIGELNESAIDASVLGWDQLSAGDQQEMIHIKQNGDVHIQAICEECETSLTQHPEYHELDHFIQ